MAEGFGNFENTSGRKSRARIEKTGELGVGSMADVDKVKTTLISGAKERNLESLVVKQYRDIADAPSPQNSAKKSLENYKLLKGLHFPVPPTYRLDEKQGSILMTNVNILHPESVSITSSVTEGVEKHFITGITNLDVTINEALRYAEIAATNNIYIGSDAYNLTVPKTGVGDARLFCTDLEHILQDWNVHENNAIRKFNVEGVEEFFYQAGLDYAAETYYSSYFSTLGRIIGEKKAAAGLESNDIDEALKKFSGS